MNYPAVYSHEQGYAINLVGKGGLAIQISIHSPTQYICANRERVLPDWQNQHSLWVAVILQRSRYSLSKCTPETETEKQGLRQSFMRFGFDVAFNLRDRGFFSDLIDPRTGYPLLSRPGMTPHNDTAVVRTLLKYPVYCNQCRVLVHPMWGMAVYPSILLSAAPPFMFAWVIKNIAPLHGWEEIRS